MKKVISMVFKTRTHPEEGASVEVLKLLVYEVSTRQTPIVVAENILQKFFMENEYIFETCFIPGKNKQNKRLYIAEELMDIVGIDGYNWRKHEPDLLVNLKNLLRDKIVATEKAYTLLKKITK
jgi:hypothetical protein